jgi:hypothetical protein
VIDTSPIEKIAYGNKDDDLTEDELIEKIIAKLRPQIKEIVANKETAVRDTALTSPRFQSRNNTIPFSDF